MRNGIIGAAAAAVFGLGLAGPALAETVRAQDPQTVVKALQNAGYRAELTKDDAGDPMVRSASSGSEFLVFFYGCTDNRDCTTIQFFDGHSDPANASLETINRWNADNRFGRAYLADSGAARIEMDVDLDDGGMSEALFVDNLEYWVAVMAAFARHVGGN